MNVFVAVLGVCRVQVLQMRKRSQNRLDVRLVSLKSSIEMKIPEVTLLPAMIFWNLKENVCLELEYFCSPNTVCSQLGEGRSPGTVSNTILWCVICQSSFHLLPRI